jgi:hypothetical protein
MRRASYRIVSCESSTDTIWPSRVPRPGGVLPADDDEPVPELEPEPEPDVEPEPELEPDPEPDVEPEPWVFVGAGGAERGETPPVGGPSGEAPPVAAWAVETVETVATSATTAVRAAVSRRAKTGTIRNVGPSAAALESNAPFSGRAQRILRGRGGAQ